MRADAALVALLVVAGALLSGCGDDTPEGSAGSTPGLGFAAGVQYGAITVGGLERSYRLFVPGSLRPGEPAALVIAMHGGLGTPDQFAENSRFDRASEKHGFLVVYPEGVSRTWNGGACCGPAVRQDIDDVGFISALIDHLSASTAIDPGRVFATGHSNGGIMAFRLACELSDRIAAIGAVAASLEIERCDPSRPVAVLAIHGDADLNHPLEGGMGSNSVAGVPFQSLAASMEKLRTANGCGAHPAAVTEGAITTTTWSGCREGGATVQQVIAGASHAWPGAERAGLALVGPPTQELDATEAVWRFFETHPRSP